MDRPVKKKSIEILFCEQIYAKQFIKYWKEENGYSFLALVTVKRRHAQSDSGLKQVSHKYTCN